MISKFIFIDREGEISLLEEEWEKEKGERDGQNCNI